MADFESVQAVRGAKLSDLKEHVLDVLAVTLAPEDEYQTGTLALSSFDFVSYVVSGLSAAMQTPASGVRATTHVTLPLSDDAGGTDKAEQDVTVYGPGDVLGVDPGEIVRRYPAPGSTNAEETFHAHIEFDRPELPWAFSAETRRAQMRAWLALVVLEAHEVVWEPAQAGLQPIMAVSALTLPPLGEAWAWAHAQATHGDASLSARLSTAWAPVNLSRLLAARILTQNTNYIACLVPTTDVGRRAGLGLGGGTLGPAWGPQDGTVRLPVYDRWEFRTAPDGDFARLARRLEHMAAPWAIGRRVMDTSRPGDPLSDLGPNDSGRTQVIRCALYSPAPRPAGAPADDARWSAARTDDLRTEVERPGFVEGTAGRDPGGVPNLPIIGPRLYAKGQRATTTVPPGDWLADINLHPANRVVAGLGTRVVAKDQEPLMQAAWNQVGEIERANRALALAELARNLATTVHRRMAQLDPGRLLQLTRPLSERIRIDGAALTLAGQTTRSATPTVALSGSFRRALRPTGPVMRRLTPTERAPLTRLVASQTATRDFSRPYAAPDGIGGLSTLAIEQLDPKALGLALKTSQVKAVAAVSDASTLLGRGSTLATAMTSPSLWNAPDTSFEPGRLAVERATAQIQAVLPAGTTGVVAGRSLGGLLAGVAATAVSGSEAAHPQALELEAMTTAEFNRLGVAPTMRTLSSVATTRPVGEVMMRSNATRTVLAGPSIAGPSIAGSSIAGHAGLAQGANVAAGRAHGFADPRSVPLGGIRGGPGLAASTGTGVGRTLGVGVQVHGGPLIEPGGVVVGAGGAVAVTDQERLSRFITAEGTQLATWIERANAVKLTDIRAEIVGLIPATGVLALPSTPPRATLDVTSREIMTRLHPSRTVVDTMRARLQVGATNFDAFADARIRPIMAAPRFDRPMYQALYGYDREWLIPGLGTLPEPELVTLLSSNEEFTEAFLVGLSDEMGRELLWRNYPTDSRGTYFFRFWNGAKDELSQHIHRFSTTKLGSHVTFGSPGQSGRAVVLIRGEIVRRYPDLTVMALKAAGNPTTRPPALPDVPNETNSAASLFHAMLPPDVMLVGLDIAIDSLREPGWWIVLAEHPQATRFRRREHDLAADEVAFAKPGANADGAAVASARIENPTRIAFEAGDFLPTLA